MNDFFYAQRERAERDRERGGERHTERESVCVCKYEKGIVAPAAWVVPKRRRREAIEPLARTVGGRTLNDNVGIIAERHSEIG